MSLFRRLDAKARPRGRVFGLACRLAAHRWPQSLGLALAGVVLSAPIVGLSAVYASGIDAIKESVRSEFGYEYGWKLQASEAAASKVASAEGVTAVRVGTSTVATPLARADALVWLLDNGNAPLGLVIEGRHAVANGEATVSRHLADTLAVELGSSITLASESKTNLKIVGITTDPADRFADLVISVSGGRQHSDEVTYWVTPEVSAELDFTPGLTASSVVGTTETRIERAPALLKAFERAVPVTAALAVLVVVASILVQLPATMRDVGALQAAGMATAKSWRVAATWIALSISAGSAVGAVAVLGALEALSDPISRAFGQTWTSVTLPLLPVVLVVVLPLMLAIAPVRIFVASIDWIRREDKRAWGTRRIGLIAGAALVATGALLIALALLGARDKLDVPNPELLGLLGILGVSLGVRLSAHGLVGLGFGRASRGLTRELAGQLTVGTSVALILGTATAAYSAWYTHNAYALETINVAPQEPGSYLVYQAPAEAAEQVLERYRQFGGQRAFVYDLPDEGASSVRATMPAIVECLGQSSGDPDPLSACLQTQAGIMSFAALDRELSSSEVLVQEELLDSAGTVGIVVFGSDGTEVTATEVISGTASAGLGGNMPGVVLSPENPLANEYRLTPSGLVEFGMLDFGSLRSPERAQIRGLVATYAPAAQTDDSSKDSSLEQSLTISILVALIGAALVLIVQLATSVSIVSGARQTRIAVGAAGVALPRRTAMSLHVTGSATLGVLVSGLLIVAIAPRVGYLAESHIGWAWSIPLITQVVVLLGLSFVLLRAPRR